MKRSGEDLVRVLCLAYPKDVNPSAREQTNAELGVLGKGMCV